MVLHWVYCHWCRFPLLGVGLWSPRQKWMDTLSCTGRSFPLPLELPLWVYSLLWPEDGSNLFRNTGPGSYSHSRWTPGHSSNRYLAKKLIDNNQVIKLLQYTFKDHYSSNKADAFCTQLSSLTSLQGLVPFMSHHYHLMYIFFCDLH